MPYEAMYQATGLTGAIGCKNTLPYGRFAKIGTEADFANARSLRQRVEPARPALSFHSPEYTVPHQSAQVDEDGVVYGVGLQP